MVGHGDGKAVTHGGGGVDGGGVADAVVVVKVSGHSGEESFGRS